MHAFLDVVVRHLGLTVRAVRVAEVDDLEPVEDLEAQIHVVGARLIGGGPDRARAEPRAGPVRGPDVERRADDRDVGSPRLELFDLGEERPVPERGQTGVGEVELFGHPRRKLALMIVIVTHGLTVQSSALGVGPVGDSIGRVTGLTLNRSEHFGPAHRT